MERRARKMPVPTDNEPASESLGEAFWNVLKGVATRRGRTLAELVAEIQRERDEAAGPQVEQPPPTSPPVDGCRTKGLLP